MFIHDMINNTIRNKSIAEFLNVVVTVSTTTATAFGGIFILLYTLGFIGDGIESFFTTTPNKTSIISAVYSGDQEYLRTTETTISWDKDALATDDVSEQSSIDFIGHAILVKSNGKYTETITTDKNKIVRIYKGLNFNKSTPLYLLVNHRAATYESKVCSMSENLCIPVYPLAE